MFNYNSFFENYIYLNNSIFLFLNNKAEKIYKDPINQRELILKKRKLEKVFMLGAQQ